MCGDDANQCWAQVWLLEMNSNPALHTNCEVLKEVIPGVVMETLGEALCNPQTLKQGAPCLPSRGCARPPSPQIHTPANLVLQHPEDLRGHRTLRSGPAEGRPCPPSPPPWCRPHLVPSWVPPLGSLTPNPAGPQNLHPTGGGGAASPPLPRPVRAANAPAHPLPRRPQTWPSRPFRRACATRRCCLCSPSAASRSCTTARRTCGRAWGAPAAPSARRPHGQRARPTARSHLRPAPSTGRARAGPRGPGAPEARTGGRPRRRGGPDRPAPAPTAPRAGSPGPSGRARALGTRRESPPRGWRRGARTRGSAAPSGRAAGAPAGPIKATLLQSASAEDRGPRPRVPPCSSFGTSLPLPHRPLVRCWDLSLGAGVGGLGEPAGASVLLGGEELPTAFPSALLAAPVRAWAPITPSPSGTDRKSSRSPTTHVAPTA